MAIRSFLAGNRWLIALMLVVVAVTAVVRATLGYHDDIAAIAALCVGAVLADRFWPVLDRRLIDAPMAPLIAFVGCDGSGKSTLTGDLFAQVRDRRSVAICYLGLGSGAIGERIKRLPVVGGAVERALARKAKQTRTRGEKIPGFATALVIYLFSLARLRRFNRMLRLRRAGVTVLTDRYPQVECPGFYDGPGLSAARPHGRLVAALARQERRLYDYMAAFRPDVVVRLNIDAATAFARKPDHRFDLLEQKVAATRRLRFAGAPIIDLDATRPYDAVYRAAAAILHDAMARRAPGRRTAVAA